LLVHPPRDASLQANALKVIALTRLPHPGQSSSWLPEHPAGRHPRARWRSQSPLAGVGEL